MLASRGAQAPLGAQALHHPEQWSGTVDSRSANKGLEKVGRRIAPPRLPSVVSDCVKVRRLAVVHSNIHCDSHQGCYRSVSGIRSPNGGVLRTPDRKVRCTGTSYSRVLQSGHASVDHEHRGLEKVGAAGVFVPVLPETLH